MSRWFRSAVKPAGPTMNAVDEDQHLQSVEEALLKLLNDDIEEADRMLKQGNSSYHCLGRGISSFIGSMLGAEKELLKQASATLHVAETKTWEDMKTAERESTAFRSTIYPPGTEYLLCYSIAQLTSAITGVLSGSVSEAVKGFYKLRKAFLTLDGIMDIESNYLKQRALSKRSSLTSQVAASLSSNKPGAETPSSSPADTPTTTNSNSTEFVDAPESPQLDESPSESTKDRYSVDETSRESEDTFIPDDLRPSSFASVKSKVFDLDPATAVSVFTTHTDIFIHSGTRFCYGLLLLVFSMIENPLFNRILYIVGFKGDRDRGTLLLWHATRFESFVSAIAGITLLGYYNGLVAFCDILPTDNRAEDDLSGYPKARCQTLLVDMRRRYPESRLWKMEEARMNAFNRNLPAALEILTANSNSKMKQIAVINMFERSLISMFIHDYALCAETWEECGKLSSWSPTLYAYVSGIALVELYRSARESNPDAAEAFKDKATEYIRKGPPLAGRQKVMAKQLPFDVYIVRKVQKWEERAKEWDVDLVDAIGTSPLTEMMYFWNGVKKQSPVESQKDLELLRWQRTGEPEKHQADLDETAVEALLRASVLRNLGKFKEARELLQTEILSHDRHEFKGHLKDDWALPSAHYEMACLAWSEKDLDGVDHDAMVLDCAHWLDKTQKWGESYVLDSRMSIKITTSQQTLRRHRRIMGI